MQLKEVMTRDVEMVRPETTLSEAARKMKTLDIGPIPVCDGSEILGMVTDRDITIRAVAEGLDPARTQVREVMTQDIIYCFEDQEIAEAARLMQQRQVHRLLILNRKREVAGIVSLSDIAEKSGDNRLSGSTGERVPGFENRERGLRGGLTRENVTLSNNPREGATANDRAAAQSPEVRVTARSESSAGETRQRDLTGRKTIAGLFPDRRSAERAIDDLKKAGFSADQIGLVMRDNVQGRQSSERHKETHAAEGAVTGALGGGVLGGVAGYLIAIGALTIPGIGPVLAGGALAEALGVVVGTAAVAAGLGAAAGGLVGVLVGMGIPEEEARHFERGFGATDALVTVKAGDRIMEALAILEMNDADTGVGRRVKS